jgi:hypothetical protein
VNAGRFARSWIGHQNDDGADAFMPAECVVEIEQTYMQPPALDKISLPQRVLEGDRLPPQTQCGIDSSELLSVGL